MRSTLPEARIPLPLAVLATIVAVVAPLSSGAESLAQDDAAGREASLTQDMEMIGPFVDDLTFLVVKVDPERLDFRPTFERLIELLPDSKSTFHRVAEEAAQEVRELRERTGGNAIYVVASWTVLPPLTPKHSAIAALSDDRSRSLSEDDQGPRLPVIRRAGGVSIIIPDERGRVPTEGRASHPTPRPELSAAWGAVEEYPVGVLLVPPPHAARTIKETLPELPQALGGGSSRVVTEGLRWAALGIDPRNVSARLVIQSDSKEAAAALGARVPTALRLLYSLVEQKLRIPGPLRDQLIRAATPAVEGDRLVLQVDRQDANARFLAAAAYTLAESFYGAAAEVGKLKQLGLALHNYYDVYRHCPPPKDGRDDKGRPLLSWRVHLLPYLGETRLYQQFHLGEAWDSPHNRKLIEKMPAAYRMPRSRAKRGYTTLLAPVGEDTVFGGTEPARFSDVWDGTVNTIFLVDVKDELAVVWTAPHDYEFDPEKPGKGLRLDDEGQFLSAFMDGSVHRMSLERNQNILLHLFQKADRQAISIE